MMMMMLMLLLISMLRLMMMMMILMVMMIMMMMIPKESKDLVPWKVGEEGFILRERGTQQFHRLNYMKLN